MRYLPVEQLVVLLDKAEAMGRSSNRILRECHHSFDVEDLRNKRVRQVSEASFAKIVQNVFMHIRSPENADFDMMSRDDFDLMCHALVTSSSLREVVERQARFFEICGRRYGWIELEETAGRAIVHLGIGPIERCWEAFFTINGCAVFLRLFDWLIGGRLDAKIAVASAGNTECEMVASLYPFPTDFEAGYNGFSFSVDCLERPVVRGGDELRSFLKAFPFDVFVETDTEASLCAQVASAYRDAICNGRPLPDVSTIARRLGMSGATVRRHLDDQGEPIRLIKSKVRYELATELLSKSDLQIDEIGRMLGFSGANAFNRAFLKWNGQKPALYRATTGCAADDRFDRSLN